MGTTRNFTGFKDLVEEGIEVVEKNFASMAEIEFVKWIKTVTLPSLKIITSGLYVSHLVDWMHVFKREQFIFINGEDLLHNPAPVFQDVEAALGLLYV